MMGKLQFELYVTVGDKQEAFVLETKPVMFGSNQTCHVQLGDGEPHIKAIIQRQDDSLLVKVFDPNFPIEINGKNYKSAKIKNSTFFKVGPVDVIASIEEVKGEAFLSEVYEESKANGELDEYVEEVRSTNDTKPNITLPSFSPAALSEDSQPVSLPDEPVVVATAVEEVVASSQEADNKKVIEQQVSSNYNAEEDFFEFDIKFDESGFNPQDKSLFMDSGFEYSSYVDFKEVDPKKLPEADIIEDAKGHALHVIYMNNGVVIDEKHFDPKHKRIFLSNEFSDQKTFKVTDFDEYKKELIFIRDRKVFVVGQNNYKLQKVDDTENIIDWDQPTLQLVTDERIVLTKGTSQIIIKIAPSPPGLKHVEFFDFDEKLLKITSSVWVAVLVPLLLILLIAERPQEEKKKKEIVVIYKKKKMKKPTKSKEPQQAKKEVAKAEKPQEKKAEAKKEPLKKQEVKVAKKEPIKTKKTKTPPKKIAKVNPTKKKSNNKPKITKNKNVTKKVADVKKSNVKTAPKKNYKFSSSSKMSAMLGTNNTKLKKVNQASSVDVASTMGSSSSLTRNFNSNKFGKSDVKVESFNSGSTKGRSNAVGTRGLSGKTKATTAYIEANTKILGAMDPELIRKIMREYIPQFRYCYQQELMKNPSVAGVFDLNFQINARGSGINVGVKKNGVSFSRKAQTCLKRVVKMIRFPKPKGGGLVDVRQPMNFYKQ